MSALLIFFFVLLVNIDAIRLILHPRVGEITTTGRSSSHGEVTLPGIISQKVIGKLTIGICIMFTGLQPIIARADNSPVPGKISLRNTDEAGISTRSKVIRTTENILTGSWLENLRKADQLEKDEVVSQEQQSVSKVLLLFPIIEIREDIKDVIALLSTVQSSEGSIEKAGKIMAQNKFESKNFKKIFNRYSDNIFYQDARQANLYLAGGTSPNSLQTQQYLFRNAALTAVSNVKDDIKSLIECKYDGKLSQVDSQTIEDSIDDAREALEALGK